jgi:probable HAF family extracellular repeat protein
MQDLGTPLGTTNSLGRANAINNTGLVAGQARNATDTATEATLWRLGPGGATATTIGSPRVGAFSEFFGLNDLGHAVGRYTDAAGRTRAFLFDGIASTDLGLLSSSPTFVHARALDLNESGDIVGHVAQFDNAPGFGGAAVLWRGGMIFDLNTLIDPGTGWRLLSAEGINDAGQIVGYGTLNGQTRAFVMTAVPEPSTLVLASLGAVGLMAAARRSRRRGAAPAA